MEVWIVVHDYYQLFVHSVILIECVLTLMIPSVHMASIIPVHPGEGSSSVACDGTLIQRLYFSA